MGRLIDNMRAAIDLSATLRGEIDRANASIPSVESGEAGGVGGGEQPVNIVFNDTSAPGVSPQAFALAQKQAQDVQARILIELRSITRGVLGGQGGPNGMLNGVRFRMKGN